MSASGSSHTTAMSASEYKSTSVMSGSDGRRRLWLAGMGLGERANTWSVDPPKFVSSSRCREGQARPICKLGA